MTESALPFESMDPNGVLEYMRQHSDSYVLCSFALKALSEKIRSEAVAETEQTKNTEQVWDEASNIVTAAREANTGQ